jgi:uncharacterized LabA/DUF88 family protein
MAHRVMVFIDGSNLYHTLKSEYGRTDLDFTKFCRKLCDDRQLIRVYYYNATVDPAKEPDRNKDQQRFFQRIRRLPYFEVRLGSLIYRNWPTVPPYEKGLDIKLATDLLVHAFRQNYDTAVLISGDNDFADALQAAKDFGRNIEVALFKPAGSQKLRDVADRTIEVDANFLSDCWSQQ